MEDSNFWAAQEMSQWERAFGMVGYIGALVGAIATPIIMMNQIQHVLHPASRSAVLAAGAFLTPLEEVFAFLEDTMTVRINFAMGAGDKALTNRLFNAGILIGLVSGSIAALLATLLTIDAATFEALIYPEGGGTADFAACRLLPHASEVAAAAKPYWLLSAWQWPFVFVNKSLVGFFLGGGMLWLYGWPSIIRSTATLLVWFVGLAAFPNAEPTSILGMSSFVGPPLATAFFTAIIWRASALRKRFGIACWLCGGGALSGTDARVPLTSAAPSVGTALVTGNGDGAAGDEPATLTTAEFVCGSLKCGVIDLCQQLPISAGVYVAAAQGLGISYQIAALQSAMPSFGVSWVMGFGLAIKVIGPKMIAQGNVRAFIAFVVSILLYVVGVMGVVSIGAVVPFGSAIAANFGETACPYATEMGCAPIYHQIFAGRAPLSLTFEAAFSATSSLNMLYLVVKPTLYALLDFDFMCAASLASLVFFAPCLLIAVYAFDALAPALFLAMYAPHIILIPVFLARLAHNVRKLLHGEPGPWTPFVKDHAKAESIRHSLSSASGAAGSAA